jgi:hypothetical protein
LVLVEVIAHDDYEEGEKYLQKRLAAQRARGAGAREHYHVDPAELAEVFKETRRYLDEDLPRERQVATYAALEAGEDVLPATPDMFQVKQRLGELDAARASLQPEQDRLDAEIRELQKKQWADRQRLNRAFAELDAEKQRLATTAKLAIGPAAGIDGIASWESVRDRNRRFDPEWLKTDAPELFDAYRTAFDAARFRNEQVAAYQAHMRVTTHREFRWTYNEEPGTEEGLSRGNQPQRGSMRNRLFGANRTGRRRRQ